MLVQPNIASFIVSTPELSLQLQQLNPPQFLTDETLMIEAAQLYRVIYGSEEVREGSIIWGDGARDKGNPKNKIALDEYYRLEAEGNLTAPSGEQYELCFPNDYMIEKFRHELVTSEKQQPYLACLKAHTPHNGVELVGLTWGGLTDLELIKESLYQDLIHDTAELTPKQFDELMALLRPLADESNKLLYIRELVLREDFRKAGQYATHLVQLAVEHGEVFGNARLFFWTSASSLMTYIALAGGLKRIYSAGEYEFFFGEDAVMRKLAEDYRVAKDPGLFFKQRLLSYLRSQRKAATISVVPASTTGGEELN